MNLAQTDFYHLINEVYGIMSTLIVERGIYLHTDIALDVPKWIHTDGKRLKQALFNLIGNANKFTFNGGITLKVYNYDKTRIKVEIKDTGIGINEEDIAKLFSPFGKLQSSQEINTSGVGLGLSISKMVVNKLNGDVWCTSVKDKGTTFHFTFEHKRDLLPKEKLLSRKTNF